MAKKIKVDNDEWERLNKRYTDLMTANSHLRVELGKLQSKYVSCVIDYRRCAEQNPHSSTGSPAGLGEGGAGLQDGERSSLLYWRHRCEAAEELIDKIPCDPDVYSGNAEKAESHWKKLCAIIPEKYIDYVGQS